MKDVDPALDQAPIFELMSQPTTEIGDHLNTVWRAMAYPYGTIESGTAVIIKALNSPVAIATEMACALAGQFLKLPIPQPCIVLCDSDLITEIPAGLRDASLRTADGQLIYFGSKLVFEYPVRPIYGTDPTVVEQIWSRVCRDEVAPAGAAWDELVANPDRHHNNMTFDGDQWWLYDHDKALSPLADLYARLAEVESRTTIASHRANRNQIASQMVDRQCDVSRISQRSRSMGRNAKPFDLFISRVERWSHTDARLNGLLTLTKDVLRSIQIRLPAIELLIEQRLQRGASAPLLWSDENA